MLGGGERWGGRGGGGRGESPSKEGGRCGVEGGTLVSKEDGAGRGEGCRAEQARDLGNGTSKLTGQWSQMKIGDLEL